MCKCSVPTCLRVPRRSASGARAAALSSCCCDPLPVRRSPAREGGLPVHDGCGSPLHPQEKDEPAGEHRERDELHGDATRPSNASGASAKSVGFQPVANERSTRPPDTLSTTLHSSATRRTLWSGRTTLPRSDPDPHRQSCSSRASRTSLSRSRIRRQVSEMSASKLAHATVNTVSSDSMASSSSRNRRAKRGSSGSATRR